MVMEKRLFSTFKLVELSTRIPMMLFPVEEKEGRSTENWEEGERVVVVM